MCGIVGILSAEPREDLAECAREMAQAIFHRGPDQQGLRADSHLAMGMNRLAIVDASAHAIPYANEDGTVQLVYNGEVYNHLDIRQRLQGAHRFANTGDAETIVHAYEERGMRMLGDFNGMYAFALADLAKQKLFLVRDKVGEKPLYYAVSNGSLYFASEIKALLTQIEAKLNPDCLSYRAFEVCTDRETLFNGVHALLPGEFLEISMDDVSDIASERYWHVMDHLIRVPDDEGVHRARTDGTVGRRDPGPHGKQCSWLWLLGERRGGQCDVGLHGQAGLFVQLHL